MADAVGVPVIGIGAGPDVDGQVLVTYDMIGLFDRFVPKFVKQYTNIRSVVLDALQTYKGEVQSDEAGFVTVGFKRGSKGALGILSYVMVKKK